MSDPTQLVASLAEIDGVTTKAHSIVQNDGDPKARLALPRS